MDVSVRELKNRLSEYLRRVQAGEELIVTKRGKPVARFTQAEGGNRDDPVSRLRKAAGVIMPHDARRRPPRRVRTRNGGLSDAVEEERKNAKW